MAQTINTNIASLTAQRNLAASQKDAATAMQRLSSGLRINSAKDDAAGLAIASRLTSQINGINQAIRNANDGLSVAQIAEGALSETTNVLQRMREIAVQSLNASNSVADRASLQTEMEQLHQEVTRIASTTAFGETKLLNGSFSQKAFQVGANVGESVVLSISSAKAADLGAQNTLSFTDANFQTAKISGAAAESANSSAIAAQTLTFTNTPPGGTAVTSTVTVDADDSASEIADKITSDVDGVRASAHTALQISDGTNAGTYSNSATAVVKINGVSLSVSTGGNFDAFVANVATAAQSATGLNNLTFNVITTGGTTADDVLEISDETGADITFGIVSDGADTIKVDVDSLDKPAFNSNGGALQGETGSSQNDLVEGNFTTATGYVSLTTDDPNSVHTFKSSVAVGATGIGSASAVTGTVTAGTSKLDDVNVTTVSGAKTALDIIDSAITSVNDSRATLGAVQSRMDAVVSNLSSVSENSQAARSRIMDADFASETAQLAKTQILQQAGISVLAQANAQPQNVLALLQ